MTDSIYQEIILEHYRNPQNQGRIRDASKSVSLSNPLCGDTITLDILYEGKSIKDVKYEAQGCAISTASASLLSELVMGKTKEEVSRLSKETLTELLGIELSLNRLKCALLPLRALQEAVKI